MDELVARDPQRGARVESALILRDSVFWKMTWSRLEDKLFEQALVVFPDETPNRWEMIADRVPRKSPAEVRRHYEDLVHDVAEIDGGKVEPPMYGEEAGGTAGWGGYEPTGMSSGRASAERRRGVPWTEEEHRMFLVGLQRYGKGDWRSISRNAVVSRTPTQVASHAQKYFLRRLKPAKREKKRPSIHDAAAGPGTSWVTEFDDWAGHLSAGVHWQ
ncbi:hypothetical protein SAY87_001847 [Trapa incisa]|uniref:Uncharacterized protein n=1 Tax=Trapa incisa TaxID=236973 RepID=A0AAN7JYQ8_9MYRT|nr:hypothetical protein SAY87_001847 [Trapa incisa]